MRELDDLDDVEISFPLSFAVGGTPVSSQSSSARSRQRWKEEVVRAARTVVVEGKWLTSDPFSLLIYDFPEAPPQGDVDNIVKLIQDALCHVVYVDDSVIRRVVAQRFLDSELEQYDDYPDLVAEALVNDPPFVFIRLSRDYLGEAL